MAVAKHDPRALAIGATLTKLDIARHQLGTALDLFIRDRDAVSVQCLACGGAELIEGIATHQGVEPLSTHMLQTYPHMDMNQLRKLQRQYWNAFKHMTMKNGEVRDDTDTLALFVTPKTTLRFLSDGGITVRSLKSCLCPLRFFKCGGMP